MSSTEHFKAWVVSEETDTASEKKRYQLNFETRQLSDLPDGEVLIDVSHSSVNYKDALSAQGNLGVTRVFPHTPGIDAVGKVLSDSSGTFKAGDEVIVTGYDLGMNTAGGFGEIIQVPASWVVRKPASLTALQSMAIGTAGLTAAWCIEKLLHNGLQPSDGPVLVTGASGGVGSVAVNLLADLGFEVHAMSGSESAKSMLTALGASEIVSRQHLGEGLKKPMLKEVWAGAVDCVGGDTLFQVVKSLKYGGSVACWGLVAGPAMSQATVFPFILRGVNLLGVDSVNVPLAGKQALWDKLANEWTLSGLSALTQTISPADIPDILQKIQKGETLGRYVLDWSQG